MPPGCLPGEERPRTGWKDYVSLLAWERAGEELHEVAGEREVWLPSSGCCLRGLTPDKR